MAEQQKLSLADTPEFKAEVARAVQAEVAKSLAAARETAGTAIDGGDAKFAEKLALAIASLQEQGPGAKKFVAPELLQARAAARERMMELIVEARASKIVPRYSLRAKVFLDEVLVDPMWVEPRTHITRPTVIEWPGVPNEAMRPCTDHLASPDGEDEGKPRYRAANEIADAIYKEFRASIGSKTPYTVDRPQRVTAGGLVVHGAPKGPKRETAAPAAQEGLRIAHRSRGINVLGTVAEPARENMA